MFRSASIFLAGAVALLTPALASASGGNEQPAASAVRASFIPAGQPMMAPMGYIVYCVHNRSACLPSTGGDALILGAEHRLELGRINRDVNAEISPRRDTGRGYAADEWNVEPAAGDCKDFALTKRQRLISAGWAPKALRLAIAQTPSGEGHTVLVVRTNLGDLVLDNRRDAIVGWQSTDLHFIGMQSAGNPKLWNRISKARSPLVASND